MNNINYQKELERTINMWQDGGHIPSILLHSCCAPCSSYCLEYLTQFAHVTVFYFNPNITSPEEYSFRLSEQKRLIEQMPFTYPVGLIEGRYEPEEYFRMAEGLETEPERGARCHRCYRLRLKETARVANEQGFEYFATTLTLSPLKPADVINEIGLEIANLQTTDTTGAAGIAGATDMTGTARGSSYLPTDFKKKGGYLRSIELSREYNLYRQNYCGCVYSKGSREL